MTSSDEDVNILTTCFCLVLYRVEVAALVIRPSRSIDRSINRSVAIIAQYALTTKTDLKLFSPVKSGDEDIFIFRGYCIISLEGQRDAL